MECRRIKNRICFDEGNQLDKTCVECLVNTHNQEVNKQIAELQEKLKIRNSYIEELGKDLDNAKDKLHRRNMLIKSKDKRIKKLEQESIRVSNIAIEAIDELRNNGYDDEAEAIALKLRK